MAGLIVFIVVCWAIKSVAVDIAYAVRWGKPTPRTQMKMAQLKAGQQTTPGFTDYLGMVWNDVWADAIKAREAKRARQAAGTPKQRGAAGTFLANWWNDGWARAEAKRAARQNGGTPAVPGTPATPAVPATPAAPGTAGPTAPPGTPANPPAPGSGPTPPPATLVTPDTPANPPGAGQPSTPGQPATPNDPGTPEQPAGPTPDQPAAPDDPTSPQQPDQPGTPADPSTPGQPAPQTPDPAAPSSPGEGPAPAPVDSHVGQPLADVIPLRKENPTMPDATPGEVSGLVTAQQYAAQMSTAMANQVPLTENFMASLTSNEVSGDAVAAAARAQELSAAASQAWTEANTALHRQDVVKEAYAAVPDAGNKGFVTGE